MITTDKSLQYFIEDRHDDKYQLSHVEKVRIDLRRQKAILTLKQTEIDKLNPVLNNKPTYWRLTVPTSNTDKSEELVLSMQGVITNKDLPPILQK
jgi:hypothetical protein